MANVKMMKVADIKEGPIVRPPLSGAARALLRLAYDALAGVIPEPFEEWIEPFRRDVFLTREIACWVAIAGGFRHFTAHLPPEPAAEVDKKNDIFQVLLACTMGGADFAIAHKARTLSASRRRAIAEAFCARPRAHWVDQIVQA